MDVSGPRIWPNLRTQAPDDMSAPATPGLPSSGRDGNPAKPKLQIKQHQHHFGGTTKNEQILKYRNLFEKAAEFALFLDGIEHSCSQGSDVAFLYIEDGDYEPENPGISPCGRRS